MPSIHDVLDSVALDPCSNEHNPVHAAEFYFPPQDGLKLPWVDRTYVNPPYDDLKPWLRRIASEAASRKRIMLMLSLSRTEQPYFQTPVFNQHLTAMLFFLGKLPFGRPDDAEGAAEGMLASWAFFYNIAPSKVHRSMGKWGKVLATGAC